MTTDDDAALAAYATALADAIDDALPRWIERCIARHVPLDAAVARRVPEVVAVVQAEVGTQVRALLATDIDAQRANPLALLRAAVRHPNALLAELGAPVPERDEFSRRNFPEDVYDLTPASFADVDPSLHEPGLVWGAAKAHVHLQRRRAEGRR